jgi:hypothetical protein
VWIWGLAPDFLPNCWRMGVLTFFVNLYRELRKVCSESRTADITLSLALHQHALLIQTTHSFAGQQ